MKIELPELRWHIWDDPNTVKVVNGMRVPSYVRTLQYRERGGKWQNVREFYDVCSPESELESHD